MAKISLRREEIIVDLLPNQVNTINLKRMFNVDPTQTWLQDPIDNSVFFPDNAGVFGNLHELTVGPRIVMVEGPNLQTVPTSQPHNIGQTMYSLPSMPTLGAGNGSQLLQFRSAIRKSNIPSCRIKVIKAIMKRGKTAKP